RVPRRRATPGDPSPCPARITLSLFSLARRIAAVLECKETPASRRLLRKHHEPFPRHLPRPPRRLADRPRPDPPPDPPQPAGRPRRRRRRRLPAQPRGGRRRRTAGRPPRPGARPARLLGRRQLPGPSRRGGL